MPTATAGYVTITVIAAGSSAQNQAKSPALAGLSVAPKTVMGAEAW
jgi:hypothetical protein